MLQRFAFTLLITLVFGSVAFGQNHQQEIDRLVRKYADGKLFNGNILVTQRGKIVFQHSYGLANMEWKVPVTADTRFRIGSLTKQFTAALVLLLCEQGRLHLNEHITTYLPWYPKEPGDKITVHHLLGHTSGLPNYTTPEAVNDLSLHDYGVDSVAKKYCTGQLRFAPGSRFEYCNSGYYLLGAILETVTKKSFAKLLRDYILNPVGMTHSGMDTASRLLPLRATGYGYGFDGYEPAEYLNPALCFYAAGGMYSTAADLLKWQQALHGGKILSAAGRELMFTPGLGNYGYGVYVVRQKDSSTQRVATVIGHNGGLAGFTSTMLYFEADDVIAILLDNTRAASRANPENIVAGIVDILKGKLPKTPVQSMQVAMIEKLPRSSGEQLVQFYRQTTKAQGKAGFDASANEAFLNNLGYFLLQRDRVKDALAVLKFVTETYPDSFNPYDTYAEALMKDGQRELAIKNYKRSLALNPANANAVQQLKLLEPRVQ